MPGIQARIISGLFKLIVVNRMSGTTCYTVYSKEVIKLGIYVRMKKVRFKCVK